MRFDPLVVVNGPLLAQRAQRRIRAREGGCRLAHRLDRAGRERGGDELADPRVVRRLDEEEAPALHVPERLPVRIERVGDEGRIALFDGCLELGQFDLLYDFAQPYSITLICQLLGVPTDRQRDLLDWSHRHVKMYELGTTEEQAVSATNAAAEFRDYVLELVEERRASPRDDMVSALVEARVDGSRLSDDEIVSTVVVLLNAGHEATVNTLGNGVTALMRHRSEWNRLVAGDVSPSAAIEELIRWDPPLQLFERWVLEDGFEVAGVPIPRGEVVSILFGSANRDPRVFADGDRLDLGRENAAEHIGFGGGIHVCIGAPLARIELDAGLRTIVERAPALELATEPARVPAFVIRGFEAVEVTAG